MIRSGLASRSSFPAMLARLGMIAAVVGDPHRHAPGGRTHSSLGQDGRHRR